MFSLTDKERGLNVPKVISKEIYPKNRDRKEEEEDLKSITYITK